MVIGSGSAAGRRGALDPEQPDHDARHGDDNARQRVPHRSRKGTFSRAAPARAGRTSATIVPIVAASYRRTMPSVRAVPRDAAAKRSGITATQGSAEKSRKSDHAVVRDGWWTWS